MIKAQLGAWVAEDREFPDRHSRASTTKENRL